MAKRKPPSSHVLKRGQRQKAQEEQEDTRRERRTEPARLYPQRAPACRRETQITHERNQAGLPMRLGVDSRESGRSRTKSLARHRARLARTPEGTRASSESSEPVLCGKRCRRCSTLKEKRVSKRRTQSAGEYPELRYSSATTSCTA